MHQCYMSTCVHILLLILFLGLRMWNIRHLLWAHQERVMYLTRLLIHISHVLHNSGFRYPDLAACGKNSNWKKVSIVDAASDVSVVGRWDMEDAEEWKIGCTHILVGMIVEGFFEEAVVGFDLKVLVYFGYVYSHCQFIDSRFTLYSQET